MSLFLYKFVVFEAKNGIEILLTFIIITRVFIEYEFNDQKIYFLSSVKLYEYGMTGVATTQ